MIAAGGKYRLYLILISSHFFGLSGFSGSFYMQGFSSYRSFIASLDLIRSSCGADLAVQVMPGAF